MIRRTLISFLAAVVRPRYLCGVCHERRRSIAEIDAHHYVSHGDLA